MSDMSAKKQALEARRETKRRQIEALFAQHKAIQDQMDALGEELQLLDDEIDQFDGQEEDESPFFVKEEPAMATQAVLSHENLTDPMTFTMHPDEILTDVSQTQPLHAETAVGVGGMQHADLPETLRPSTTSTAGSETLDSYFAKPAVATSRSSSAQLDSLQSLPEPIHPHVERVVAAQRQQHYQCPWSQQVDHLLNHTFRLRRFRQNQRDIIDATLSGEDVFVLMRTGGGKSLTYQLPAILEGSKISLVVSPLISLIRDQEEQMNAIRPGSAVSFTSNIGREEHTRRWNLVRNPASGIVMILVTPEKCHKSNKLKNELEKLAGQNRLGRFVIDECHCVSQYGHDFRPDYTKLGTLKRHFPSVPLLAVTATASKRVRQDVAEILSMASNYRFFRSTARRDNLNYQVRSKTTKVLDDMAEFIQTHHANEAGIVYAFSRKEADKVASDLCDRGIVAESYHSSVSDSKKDAIHQSWMRNNTQVVVATIAFGLGINKPDVRFVLHHSVSKSLEAYYQESGRAGRDGDPADCVLYYAPKDVSRMICLIHGDNGEQIFWQMARYAQAAGNDAVCKAILLTSLGEPEAPDPEEELRANDGITTEKKNLGKHAQIVTRLLQYKLKSGDSLTINQLVKEWRSKTAPAFVKEHSPGKELTVDECERIIVTLIIEDIISPDVVWNAYTATMYLKLSFLANNLINSPDPTVEIRLPKRLSRSVAKKTPKLATPSNADGWFETNKPKSNRKQSKSKRARSDAKKTDASRASTKKKAAGSKKRKTKEVFELLVLSSSDEEENSLEAANKSSRKTTIPGARKPAARQTDVAAVFDEISSDDSEEYQFEG